MSDCGCDGIQSASIKGADGIDGKNNYEIAIESGAFVGTLAEYLESLRGADGADAYEVAVSTGYSGTQEEWLASLVGADGNDGVDGISAFTNLIPLIPGANPQIIQPAIGQTVVAFCLNTDWLSLNVPVHLGGAPGNWYFIEQVQQGVVLLRNPGPADGYPTGIATNSPPGTAIHDTLLTSRGRDGIKGVDGISITGPVGPQAPSPIAVIGVPSNTPSSTDATLVLATDNSTTPTWVRWYSWNGSAWVIAADVTPRAGGQILFLNGDPNGQSSSYGNDGDIVMDTSTSGTINIWQRLSAGTWVLRGTVAGGSASPIGDLFRVGKGVDQPLLSGSTVPTVVQFEEQSGGNLFNGGGWNGNKYTAAHSLSTPTTFRLESFRLYTEGSPFAINFTIDLNLNGSSVASYLMVVGSGSTEGTLPLLVYTAATMTMGDVVDITITPGAGPSQQWMVDSSALVFYNQL